MSLSKYIGYIPVVGPQKTTDLRQVHSKLTHTFASSTPNGFRTHKFSGDRH
jgi:hypothetical protein